MTIFDISKSKHMQSFTSLTIENASKVSTVINKSNPEWGIKKFNHNAQPLNNGENCSAIGTGSNSRCLFESEYRFWVVASFNN